MTSKALKKRISPVSFLIHCEYTCVCFFVLLAHIYTPGLFKFQQEYKRAPGPEDGDLLVELKPKYLQSMGISDASVLDDALLR